MSAIVDAKFRAQSVWAHELVWNIYSAAVHLPSIDAFIKRAKLPRHVREELAAYRAQGLSAYEAGNFDLSLAFALALYWRCRHLGLQIAAVPDAVVGKKFSGGRKLGAVGPIRKRIAALLAKNPKLKNAELWEAISEKPPRGWVAYANNLGKYFEGPGNKNMSYRRFENACTAERKKAPRSPKITV